MSQSQDKYKCKDSEILCEDCPYPYCIDGIDEDEALRIKAEIMNQMDIKELKSVAFKRWYNRNGDKARQRSREYYNNNREKCIANSKAYRAAHPDKIKAYRDRISPEKKAEYRTNARERYWAKKRMGNG